MTTVPSTTPSTQLAVGTALYIEASRPAAYPYPKAVTQILITPEACINGTTQPMGMYRRRISENKPRATWRFNGSAIRSAEARSRHTLLVTSAADKAVVADMLVFAKGALDQLINPTNRYEIVGQPILVDVTAADYEDIKVGKTPYKVFGRVWKVRKKLGFPAEFL